MFSKINLDLIPNCIFAFSIRLSRSRYTGALFFGGRPASSWITLHCTWCWQLCSQCRNVAVDGCGTPNEWLSELCHPSARFAVLGPMLSKWDQRLGENEPEIHVLSKYALKSCIFDISATSCSTGGC